MENEGAHAAAEEAHLRDAGKEEETTLGAFLMTIDPMIEVNAYCVKCGSKENLVSHHISYQPPIIQTVCQKCHQKIHGRIPIINDLNLKMREYDRVNKAVISFKNYYSSFLREFNQELPNATIIIQSLESQKKQILKDIKSMIKDDLKKVDYIKGLGLRLLAGLLAYADPKRFPSLRKFLHYCGHKKSSKITKKYSRKVNSIVYQIVTGTIMHKDTKYYPLYRKIKENLSERNPQFRKAKIDGMAKNRTGTFLLKEIYTIFGCRNSERTDRLINSVSKEPRTGLRFNSRTTIPMNDVNGGNI